MRFAIVASLLSSVLAQPTQLGCDGTNGATTPITLITGTTAGKMGTIAETTKPLTVAAGASITLTTTFKAGAAVYVTAGGGSVAATGWTPKATCTTRVLATTVATTNPITYTAPATAGTYVVYTLTSAGPAGAGIDRVKFTITVGDGNATATTATTDKPSDIIGGPPLVDPNPAAKYQYNGCVQFCTNIMATCTGDNVQYLTQTSCLAWCNTQAHTVNFGTPTGNTFECRSYHLDVAKLSAGNATIHCKHAGAKGGGVCTGDDACTAFCANYVTVTCPHVAINDPGFTTVDQCKSACQALKRTGLTGATVGNSFECREQSLGLAYLSLKQGDANTQELHCSRASSAPIVQCVNMKTECDAFCEAFVKICGNDAIPYTNCRTECVAMRTGAPFATSGDTLQCRAYHLGIAALNMEVADILNTHCPHAAKDSAVCVGGETGSTASTAAYFMAVAVSTATFLAL